MAAIMPWKKSIPPMTTIRQPAKPIQPVQLLFSCIYLPSSPFFARLSSPVPVGVAKRTTTCLGAFLCRSLAGNDPAGEAAHPVLGGERSRSGDRHGRPERRDGRH